MALRTTLQCLWGTSTAPEEPQRREDATKERKLGHNP